MAANFKAPSYWRREGETRRRWCEFCKVWMSDNKVGIEGHESGKKHKEAVQEKLKIMRKQGTIKEKEKAEWAGMMQKIERDALAAMQKDVDLDPTLAQDSTYRSQAAAGAAAAAAAAKVQDRRRPVAAANTGRDGRAGGGLGNQSGPPAAAASKAKAASTAPAAPAKAPEAAATVWVEGWTNIDAEHPERYRYYYNTETQQSVWEKPAELIAFEAQAAAKLEDTSAASVASKGKDAAAAAAEGAAATPTAAAAAAAATTTAETAPVKYDAHAAAKRAAEANASGGSNDKDEKKSSKGKDEDGGVAGSWETVDTEARAAAAAAAAKAKAEAAPEQDALKFHGSEEVAITFATKATPALKRPAGSASAGATSFVKKRKKNPNMRGRVKKP